MLTRRGWATVGLVLLGILMGSEYGARSLNAVVAPLVVVLLAAVVQVRRTDRPGVSRTVPPDGFVGESGLVQLTFDVDQPVAATVEEALDHGLAAETTVDTTLGTGPIEYEVYYRRRGVHAVGPATVTVRDVLGLARRSFEYAGTDEVVVYPTVYELTGEGRYDLATLLDGRAIHNREEFDSLREYERGDSLRDVHWKSSAKRAQEDLIVKQFAAEDDRGEQSVTVAATADDGRGDEMAEAAASVALFLLDAGLSVGLHAPGQRIPPGRGPGHRLSVLAALARAGEGSIPVADRDEADVLVRAQAGGQVIVGLDGRETTFTRLAGPERAADLGEMSAPADRSEPSEREVMA